MSGTAPQEAAAPEGPDAEDESVTAKLARIRAVVETGAAGALGAAAFAGGNGQESETETSGETFEDADLDTLRSLIRQNEDGGNADASVDLAAEIPSEPAAEAHAADPEAPDEPEAAPIRARVVKMRRSEFAALYGDIARAAEGSADPEESDGASQPDAAEQVEADMVDTVVSDLAKLDGMQDTESDATSDFWTNADADTDAAIADLARLDGLEEYEAEAAEVTDPANSLSPDAEAELLEELAEVERMGREEDDIAAPTPAAIVPQPEIEAEAQEGEDLGETLPRESRAAFLAAPPEADEAAISRILSETDAQLNEPEASRRREAIAHLKAAVAATEAARQLGDHGGDSDEDGENMFRDDLDQVVRPRRTTRPLTRSERPRPAPLKLVPSQRVDAPQPAAPADSRPVLPRRVEAGAAVPDATEAARQERFARFVADMGTAGLTDMIEAAAAHATFNEGEEDVSRPQLMRMVQAVVASDFSREDGLRAFGTLLRQGRIEKISNGRFRVSPQTRFNPRRVASGS